MHFLRALTASIFSLVCSIALGAFVVVATLQMTVLNRDEVKTWVKDSGVYQTALTTAVDNDPVAQKQIAHTPIAPETLKAALNKTFPPTYIQNNGERIIDSTYNWLQGQAPSISYEIDTTSKKDEFITHLSGLLEPQLASLPRCADLAAFEASNPTCIPPGYTAQQLSNSLATDAAYSISAFRQPVTDENIAEAQQGNRLKADPATQKIPQIVSNLQLWTWLSPLVAVLSGALTVTLSERRLKVAKRLAGKLTFSLLVTLAVGVAMVLLGDSFRASDFMSNTSTLINRIVEPLAQEAIPAIGLRLSWISGITAACTGTLWIILRIIKKHREQAALLAAPTEPVPTYGDGPTPPSNKAA